MKVDHIRKLSPVEIVEVAEILAHHSELLKGLAFHLLHCELYQSSHLLPFHPEIATKIAKNGPNEHPYTPGEDTFLYQSSFHCVENKDSISMLDTAPTLLPTEQLNKGYSFSNLFPSRTNRFQKLTRFTRHHGNLSLCQHNPSIGWNPRATIDRSKVPSSKPKQFFPRLVS